MEEALLPLRKKKGLLLTESTLPLRVVLNEEGKGNAARPRMATV